MEELLAYALLLCAGIPAADAYEKKLDELFLQTPEDDDLLHLEWEKDPKEALAYLRARAGGPAFDTALFGKALMLELKGYYQRSNLKDFAAKAYQLWRSLPQCVQSQEPFWILSYADDPLSWGDEAQSRALYEQMMDWNLG